MNQPVEPLHDDVRQAFESILARAPEPGPLLLLDPLPLGKHTRRRHRTLAAAVAAVLALVCGAVAWTIAGRAGDEAPVGEPGQLVITDPTAISLDSLPRQARVPGEFVVLDTERLPEGWTLDSQSGRSDFAPAGAYSYAARLSGPAGERVTLVVELGIGSVEARLGEGSGPSAVVEVNGQLALQWTNEVRWMTTDGGEVAVLGAVRRAIVSVVSTGSPLSAVDLLDLARSLPLTVEAQLSPSPAPFGELPDFDHDLAGHLGGHPWIADVEAQGAPAIQVFLRESFNIGFDSEAARAAGGSSTVTAGVPGVGAFVFGLAPAGVDTVRAEIAGGTSALLPVLARDIGSYFVVPIPEGVPVTRLTFLNGSVAVGTVTVPSLPFDLDGSVSLDLDGSQEPSTTTSDPSTTVETTALTVEPVPVTPPVFPDHIDVPSQPLGDGVYLGDVKVEELSPDETAVLPMTLSRVVSGEACYELPPELTDDCSNDYAVLEPHVDVAITFTHETTFSVAQGASQSFAVTGPDLVQAYRATATGNYSPVVPGLPADAFFSPHRLLITIRNGIPVSIEQLWTP